MKAIGLHFAKMVLADLGWKIIITALRSLSNAPTINEEAENKTIIKNNHRKEGRETKD